MSRYLLAVLLLLAVSEIQAQNIKLIEAEHQSWSGGIAGRHGSNYRFVLQFPLKGISSADTIWIRDEAIVLSEKQQGGRNSYSITTKGKITNCEILAGTSKDDYADTYPIGPEGKPKAEKPGMPFPYKGFALLSYNVNGKRCYYTIKKILYEAPPVNYP